MTEVATALTPSIAPAMSWKRLVGAYAMEARCELLRLGRNPAFAIPTFCMPLLFFLVYASLFSTGREASGRQILVACLVFGTMSPGLFGFGGSVALERSSGLMEFKRAMPMPRGAYMSAKLFMAVCFATMSGILLTLAGWLTGTTHFGLSEVISLIATNALAVIPFCALGIYLGSLLPAQAVMPLMQLFYLPMGFLSGLMFPIDSFPGWLKVFASYLPPFQVAVIEHRLVGVAAEGSIEQAIFKLAVYTLVFFTLGHLRLARATRGAQD